jgi:replicative DNA helicase
MTMESEFSPTGEAMSFVQELEFALLGACFNDPAVIDAVAPIVEPDDFSEPINGRVFDLLLGRRLEGSRIDAAAIAEAVTVLVNEGSVFVENYVDAIVHPRVKPRFPKAFAVKLRAHAKERAEG